MGKEDSIRVHSYPKKYKILFIVLGNLFLVLLVLSVVNRSIIYSALNFGIYCFNAYLLANSFNKKIFVHPSGKFVYRNVLRRRMSFNIEDIESVEQTRIRRGLVLKLKNKGGFVYLTPYWRRWKALFRFVLTRVDPERIKNQERIMKSLNL